MTIALIRQQYSVPAKFGMAVAYKGIPCKIVGTSSCRLLLMMLGKPKTTRRLIVHPTDEHLKYPEPIP